LSGAIRNALLWKILKISHSKMRQWAENFLINCRQTARPCETKKGAGMSVDQRQFPRNPGNNQAAFVYIKRNGPPIMCTVADISEGGAGLTFVTIGDIPDSFFLEIKGESSLRKCKVAWRAEPQRIGVAFVRD
jgi:PilZ domain